MGLATLPRGVFFVVASAAIESHGAEIDAAEIKERLAASPKSEEAGNAGQRGAGLKVSKSAHALEQLAHVHLERAGELYDVFHPNVSFAAFDPADVSCVKLPYPRHVRKMQLACAWA